MDSNWQRRAQHIHYLNPLPNKPAILNNLFLASNHETSHLLRIPFFRIFLYSPYFSSHGYDSDLSLTSLTTQILRARCLWCLTSFIPCSTNHFFPVTRIFHPHLHTQIYSVSLSVTVFLGNTAPIPVCRLVLWHQQSIFSYTWQWLYHICALCKCLNFDKKNCSFIAERIHALLNIASFI